jgi:NAD(P)H dehydrogenase (quinone)
MHMIVVTGATGQLGRLVIASLIKRRVPADQIVAAAHTPLKGADLAALGVQVREADYGKPATLARAFEGATKLLLISSPSIDTPRLDEHKAVIDAAKSARVQLLAYTSAIGADTTTLLVAREHLATERYLAASGIPWVFLRHPSYIENYTGSLGAALEHGAIPGAAGDGPNSAVPRADLADAAAVVLTTPGRAGKIYELGADVAFTMKEFAAEVSRQSGKKVVYNDLSQQAYQAMLESVGLPTNLAVLIADSDARLASGDGLYTTARDLSDLIGRPTTTLAAAIAAGLPR